jgi:transcriptional regulator with GAF, ATPase, and Fis domain
MTALLSLARASSFRELDDRLIEGAPGPIYVQAPSAVHEAILAHVARRLRSSDRACVRARAGAGAPLFCDAALRLGIVKVEADPVACAEAIASHRTFVLGCPQGPWDHAVASALAGARAALVLVGEGASPWPEAQTFIVNAELGEAERARWFAAACEDARRNEKATDLAELEAWWSTHASAHPYDPTLERLLTLAGRSLPLDLFDHASLDASRRAVSIEDGRVAALSKTEIANATDAERCRAARALGTASDAWAHGRAAELFAQAGDLEAAGEAIARAMELGGSQAGIGAAWFGRVERIGGPAGLELRLDAAERALAASDPIEARAWCESAARIAPEAPEVALLLGRAFVQLGDLVAGRICFDRADAFSGDEEMRARVDVERAEAAYLASELDEAVAIARSVSTRSHAGSTKRAARALLGKVSLARGAWDEADAHFAEDAMEARLAGDRRAELRACSNRAIALLSKGSLGPARALLETVLEEAARASDDRARAQALSNLGLIAYREHRYGDALRHWEETIRFPQALRGRIPTVTTIANLAELRLRLGLVDHAEHALAFGRKLLGPSAPPRASAHLKWVSALVALARRDTDLARREADAAVDQADASGDRHYIESANLVAARVALEDGHLDRLEASLSRASSISPRGRAEAALLRAEYVRACGRDALEAARAALALVRTAGDRDLLMDAHALLAKLHEARHDLTEARSHAVRAQTIRDEVAASLPADLRALYRATPDAPPSEPPKSARTLLGRELIGDDPQMRVLAHAIGRVARSNSTVLICGESGTGKELVAEALHRASERARGPLVSVNCAALVETLLLSELFGHERGAFTGASARRRGRFEIAEGGTLFLDEIGDISPRTQVALLRVLQEKTFERVGGMTPIRADVRVVCATHRDLRAMVERGEFREDLYYRLRGITLDVPPLRARIEDLPKIADHLLQRLAASLGQPPKRLSAAALELLARHRWPGNVRELENVLRAAAIFADTDVIGTAELIDNVDDLRAALRTPSPRPDPDDELPETEARATAIAYAQLRRGDVSLSDMKRQIERDCIARALTETKGNITRAATLLGMKRPRLSQLVKQYGLSSTGEP